MVNLDLDVLGEEVRTIRLHGKDIKLKDLTVKEHLAAEKGIAQLDVLQLVTDEDLDEAQQIIVDYLERILDIDEDDAISLSLKQFKALRQYVGRLELYDQGFTDREIDKIEKDAAKKQIANLLE